ncbi:beta-galactosidase 2-like [Asparagus officinalis]|uniref:beta-galactosidase 2-like n=1 Tax=Asparagus officinalis TaxID=4686 RepID=UPI00098E870E|nr:beta-galactosidase 2-like [Asparagus officinalis]
MQNLTQKFVGMMKSENISQWQGGTIIVSQIENEFRHLERDQGAPAKSYACWAVKMKLDLDTGIQWIMCKEDVTPLGSHKAAVQVPPGDEGWLCPACCCKIDCIKLLNELQGSNLSIKDTWEVYRVWRSSSLSTR